MMSKPIIASAWPRPARLTAAPGGPSQARIAARSKLTMLASHTGGARSTGEQKALLLGLILAHARAQVTRSPILLLDEVAAHLDATRRAALAEELIDLGLQVF